MDQELYKLEDIHEGIELIYDADESMMSAEELGKALQGMATMLRIAGRAAIVDFDEVYVFPIEKGSIKIPFKLGKSDGRIVLLGAAGNVMAWIIIGSLEFIGQQGMSAINTKKATVFAGVDPKIAAVCLNSDYKKAVDQLARPLNEQNRKLTIKVGEKGYEITCEEQLKYLNTEKEPILPELQNGQEVTLKGNLTRMNLKPNNDLGFEYKKRKLSLIPLDEEENISKYHSFLETPYVTVHGIVDRVTLQEVPRIKVIGMEVAPSEESQISLFMNQEK